MVDLSGYVPQLVYFLPEIVLAGVAMLVLTLELWLPEGKKRLTGTLAAGGFAVAAAALWPSLVNPPEADILGRMLAVDGISNFFRPVLLLGAFVVALFAPDYLERKQVPFGEFYALLAMAVIGLLSMVAARDIVLIYLGLELSSISTYVMAGMLRGDARSMEASLKYFLVGAMGSAILLFGLTLVYGLTGATHLGEIARTMGALPETARPMALAALVFLVAGFGFKVAAVPFHMYIPDAYEGAPTPLAAFLSVGPEGAAFAVLIRVFVESLGAFEPDWSAVFALLAFVTMTLGNVTALLQTNLKRMMAYSSIAQAGYMMVAFAVASDLGVSAVMYYVLAYTVMNLGAWAVVALLAANGEGEELSDIAGLAVRAPIHAWALTIFFLSLIGIPPTAGFFAKFLLFGAAIDQGLYWLAVAIALNSVISVGYYYNVVRRMFFETPPSARPLVAAPGHGAAVAITLLATVSLGLAATPLLRLVSAAVAALP